jgi:hypothetical protein
MRFLTAAKPAMRYSDMSTPDGFRFALHCDRCGEVAWSEWYAFNMEGCNPPRRKRTIKLSRVDHQGILHIAPGPVSVIGFGTFFGRQ